MKFSAFFVSAILAVVLSGCVTTNPKPVATPLPLSSASMGSVGHVEEGFVQAIRSVQVPEASTQTGGFVGTAAGTAVGAAVGSRIGKGQGKTLATTLGALAGASTGNNLAKAPRYVAAFEIQVRLDTGRSIVITQGIEEAFRPGQRVRVIFNGGRAQVAG